jgi:hypothetical protein
LLDSAYRRRLSEMMRFRFVMRTRCQARGTRRGQSWTPRAGAAAGLRETDRLREVIGERHKWHAVRGHLHELSGDLPAAATAYADAARRATDVAERDHLVRQAAPARAAELSREQSSH